MVLALFEAVSNSRNLEDLMVQVDEEGERDLLVVINVNVFNEIFIKEGGIKLSVPSGFYWDMFDFGRCLVDAVVPS